MKFIYNDLITGQTITASSEESGYGVSNVTDIRLIKKWRATGDTAEWVKIDMGAAVDVDGVAIVGHNLSSGATIKIQANATDSWGGPSVDQAIAYRAGIIYYLFSSVQNYRWWRFTFVDAANPDAYVEVGRLMLCEHYELDEFPDADLKEDVLDDSLIQYSLSGQLYADVRIKRRVYSIGMGILQEVTRQNLLALFDTVRTHDPFVLLLDEDNTDKVEPIYCSFSKGLGFQHAGGWLWRDKRFTFREVF